MENALGMKYLSGETTEFGTLVAVITYIHSSIVNHTMLDAEVAKKEYPFLKGGGEMGRRTRAFDWSATPLGLPENWPSSLQAAVSILLNSQFPMFVWWGAELTTIYNDAYTVVAGDKHPALLGSSGKKGWAEIWPDLEPLVKDVFSGHATWSEDLPLYIKRSDKEEETFFTFSYSPILVQNGDVGGLFCACIETTEKVVSRKRIEESEQNLRNTILQAPVAMFLFRGEDLVIDTVNVKALEMIRRTDAIIGEPLLQALPELKETTAYKIFQDVYRTGIAQYGQEVLVPLERNGILEDRYFNFAYTPLKQGGNVIGVMDVATEVTDQVLARRKIEEAVALRTAELAAANKELKRSNAHLEEFAHAASHDLKEPIRKIHFFTDRLKQQLEGKLDPEDKRMFERVEDASRRMNSLIDDLLLYSHVSHKPFEKETIDLNEQIKRVLQDLDLDIQEKEAAIVVENLPTVQGYKRQLQQLFQTCCLIR
ncbi:MAG TPA: histidine kinase dimerization/phospho-acceptor domain-containing protein [Flavisolibacter sp.]|nr:histidine kinase dimerization/phospho-acceptor domain-containing protein [Flavisolibacter sp.]